jgi:hypothetical protein
MGNPGQETTGQETSGAANAEAQKNADLEAKNKALTAANQAAEGTNVTSFSFGNSSKDGPSSTLYYPSELKSSEGTTNYVKFSFFDYVGPYTSEASAGTKTGSLSAYNSSLYNNRRVSVKDGTNGTLQNIVLYMPEDISADYGAQWGGKSIQNFTAGILGAVGSAGGNDWQGFMEKLKSGGGAVLDTALVELTKTALEALQNTGQGEGLGLNDVLGATRNVVLNPNTELLFNGFDLRTFSLNFKMVARSQTETDEIRNIITTFKKAMLPSFESDTGVLGGQNAPSFIKVPALVDVKFMAGSSENPYLTQFKPCAITGLSVNYTPDGSYAVYENFAPVAINMQINFAETKLVYREEIYWGGATY